MPTFPPPRSAQFVAAVPRLAATLILARDGRDGIEIFLMQRTPAARFMPEMYVFPGGAVDAADRQEHFACGDGMDDETASTLLALERGGLASHIAAIRECYEEAGILLADDVQGKPIRLDDDARFAGLDQRRAELARGRLSLHDFCRSAQVKLAFRRLAYFSRWITPADLRLRFDTRFFIAAMPGGQTGRHDGEETVAHVWIRPADALARHGENDFPLAYATSQTLLSLSGFADVDSLMAHARAQTQVPVFAPRAALGHEGRMVRGAGDAAYAEIGKLDPDGSGRSSGVIVAGKVVPLSPLVRRITAPNAGVMTGPGTNTYLLGAWQGQEDGHSEGAVAGASMGGDGAAGLRGDSAAGLGDGGAGTGRRAGTATGAGAAVGIAVIDPGPALASHIDTLIANAGAPIRWILVTHTHSDHSPGALLLKEKTGALLMGLPPPPAGRQDHSFTPDRLPQDGEMLEIAGCRLKVIHTPGHASNHLCYLLQDEQLLFTGDQIMQGSTVVIDPPDGDMGQYLASLQRLRQEDASWLAPGHGFLMDQPALRIDSLVAHRLQREDRIRAALADAGPATLGALVSSAYADVPQSRHAIAERSLLAHLLKLQAEGVAREEQGNWSLDLTSPESSGPPAAARP